MTDVFIVRHGNTFDTGDVVTRVGARTDLPLSKSGRVQAEALGRFFRDSVPGGFARAYCSPLLRTRQTADLILHSTNPGRAVEPPLEFLREIDYGPDENQPEDRVIERIGEHAMRLWEDSAVPPPGWMIDPEMIKQQWAALFSTLSADSVAGPVLIVTSNGIARFALDTVSSAETDVASIKLKTGAFGLFEVTGDSVVLKRWGVRP